MQRHTTRWFSLFLCTSALAACGDDSATGGSPSGGSSSGGSDQGGDTSVGAGNQGGDTNVGAGNQGGDTNVGAGNQGGNGNGGQANGGSGQGGGVSAGADGANCTDDTECDGGLCLSEELTGIPGGMCSEDCTASEACTSPTSTCAPVQQGFSICLKDCDPATPGSCGAPATLACLDVDGAPSGGLCFGQCSMDNQCTFGNDECHDEPAGNCAPPEVCDNGMDDDFDGDADCADSECTALPACAAGTCATPTVIAANGVVNGTTAGAGNALDSDCAPTSGGEVVFSFTSPVTGGLFLAQLSDTDQGIHVRSDCTDPASELGCADAVAGGEVENLQIPITAGQTVFIVVDAFAAGEEDAFQLSVEALTEVCDDFIDADLDGSIDCADGPDCNGTAACTPGATALNGTCAANTDCASVAGNDPACLTPDIGVNANMCSEWCNIAANDCGANRTCLDIGADEGLCLSNCTTNAQCPANFSCTDIGAASDVCLPNVPAAWTCPDEFYNVNDGCDCGCGIIDPDCADNTGASCNFCDDEGSCSESVMGCPGLIDPLDNTTCN